LALAPILAPAAPEYWKDFLLGDPENLAHAHQTQALTGSSPGKQSSSNEILKAIGGHVTAPKVVFSPVAEFSDLAKSLGLVEANVRVSLRVDGAGNPYHIEILHPYGLGLDETAAAAVEKYRFKPAMEEGIPVRVELNVEIHFQRR
jgi:protein TonB